jgi:hypothetical protein
MLVGGGGTGRLAIPGSVLTTLGVVFLFQNAFDRFDTWSYAWALVFPTSIGIGHYIEGWWGNRPGLRARGTQETVIGLIVFVILAAFFEGYLNQSGFFGIDFGRFAFPILLILIGLALIISRLVNWPAPRPTVSAAPRAVTPAAPKESDQQPPA